MRIGIDARVLGTDRALDRYTRNLLENLAQVGKDHEFIVFVNPGHKLPKFSKSSAIEIASLSQSRTLEDHFLFCRKVSEYRLNILFHPDNRSFLFCKIPQITTLHDLTPQKFPKMLLSRDPILRARQGLYFKLQNLALRKNTKIITVSENTKRDVVSMLGIDSQKVIPIYEGVEKDFKPQPRPQISKVLKQYRINTPYFFYLGGFGKHKNVASLISAFAKIENKDTTLAIGGKPGDDASSAQNSFLELKQLVSNLKLEKRVRFVGFIAEVDLPAVYSGAKVFVYPSKYEGFGFPPLESMACGTPVICSKAASLPEVCGDAVLYANSVDEITHELEKVLSDPRLAKELSGKGLKQARKFSWKKCAKETLKELLAV
jgi:glycosyltransferase involved in cell wall biosynthesis